MSALGTAVPPVAAGVLVLVAAVVAAAESSFSHVSRISVEELSADGRRGAPRLLELVNDPAPVLNLLLLLRLLAELTATGLVTSYCLDRIGGGLGVLTAVGVMTLVVFVVGSVGPRTLGRQHAARFALVAAAPALALTTLLGPVAALLVLLGNAVTPGKGFRDGPFTGESELRDLVERAEQRGTVEASERSMIESVFELGDTIVREVMVPRTDIVVIERGKTVRQALNLLLRSGFSRVPVVGDNNDDVLGVVYLRDLVKRERSPRGATAKVEDVMRDPVFIPDSKPVDVLLREMQASLGHIAVVVDEYGGTAGLVTLEDIVEEVVGEITDEYDREAPPVEELEDGGHRVTARLPIDDLEDLYGVELPDEDVETVGGLLASQLGRVPIPGATARVAGLVLVAESAKGRRNQIGTVLVHRADPDDQSSEDHDA